ncbi:MAG: hypothetical protein Q9166_001408 [cf. Caloplaca sp. 2 TL-2023]
MGHPPEMMDKVHGMPPPYQTNSFRQQNHPTYRYSSFYNHGNAPFYQDPPPQHGYSSKTSAQLPPPYTPSTGVRYGTGPATNLQSPLPPRSSGVAVIIPSPSQPSAQSQRTTSTHAIPPQQKHIAQAVPSVKPATPIPGPSQLPPLDYQLLLLSLAEDYIAAAHRQGSLRALVDREIDMRQYYKLVATGLGCLEVVLKRFKLQPQTEAAVRLRYASVLYDETQNTREAEQTLSEGIKLCDRYRFFDLKYNMESLLARVLFEGSPRASLKFLDGVISDVEAYQHTAWVYALRFLKSSLLLELSAHQDILSALAQIRSISATADRLGDKAILAIASSMEALIHIRESGSAESIEQAQRSLAKVRSLQLDPQVARIPQIMLLANMIDLSCSLQQCDPSQAVTKMQAMQASLEDKSVAWHQNGLLLIPIQSQDAIKTPSGNGIVRKNSQGLLSITFRWTPWRDVYALGYLLSSIATAHKNTSDGLKSEQILKEGIKCLDSKLNHMFPSFGPSNVGLITCTENDEESGFALESISNITSRHIWQQSLKCFLQMHLVFALCTRTAWTAAQEQFLELQNTATSIPTNLELLDLLILYLDGVINQGMGHLDTALSIFQLPCFSIINQTASSPTQLDLSILSTLNSILIIRSPDHPSHHLLPSLLTSLEPHRSHINTSKPLRSAYNLILATPPHPTTPTIVKTKQYLQVSLSAAKATANNQLLCITLSLMSHKFFKGVVGEQSEKSAWASQNLARKGMNALWRSVSAGIVGESLELAGKGEEAEKVRSMGREIARGLPERLVQWEEDGEDVEMR